jgi:23S rRNA pseudouridine1911/1915/1917 synthase
MEVAYIYKHAGFVIREELIDFLGLTVTQIAGLLKMNRSHISNLLNGKIALTPNVALRISKVFGGRAEDIMRLQTDYDLERELFKLHFDPNKPHKFIRTKATICIKNKEEYFLEHPIFSESFLDENNVQIENETTENTEMPDNKENIELQKSDLAEKKLPIEIVENADSQEIDVDGENSQDELYEHHRYHVDKGQTQLRIDKYLANCMAAVSRNRIQEAAEAGNILVNDKPVKSNYRVKPNDVITILLDYPPTEYTIDPENIPINIAYEDVDILLVNKQAGLVVHPGVGNFTGTLLNAVAWHLQDDPHFDPNSPRVGLVHRIDKDTSGLILLAKTEDAKTKLGLQFFNKTTKRQYLALVWGNVKNDEGTIDAALARDNKDRTRYKVYEEKDENPAAKHAVTHYKVVERFGYVTLVQCQLETGRTHQIRVHMSYIGHPLFSDERYGGREILKGNTTAKYKKFIENCFEICPRQALHARTLGFVHPRSDEEMLFESELPEDMENLLDKWRKYAKALKSE